MWGKLPRGVLDWVLALSLAANALLVGLVAREGLRSRGRHVELVATLANAYVVRAINLPGRDGKYSLVLRQLGSSMPSGGSQNADTVLYSDMEIAGADSFVVLVTDNGGASPTSFTFSMATEVRQSGRYIRAMSQMIPATLRVDNLVPGAPNLRAESIMFPNEDAEWLKGEIDLGGLSFTDYGTTSQLATATSQHSPSTSGSHVLRLILRLQ